MKNITLTVYIVFLIIVAGFGVGVATKEGILISAAFPFAVALILAMCFMGVKAELLSWATFTVGLLGGTYLSTGDPVEYVVFLVYIVLSALGVFKSPYFLAVAWLLHPVWDFIPRTLPDTLHDLPLACVLFDIPIGLYLLWGAWKKRWLPFGEQNSNRETMIRTGKTIFIGFLILAASYIVVFAAGTGYLNMVALIVAVVMIMGFRMMGTTEELIAWAVLTGWLGMTYAHTGGVVEAVVFFVYVAISAYGAFKSPYALAFAWLAFIPWSFIPHQLTDTSPDFPVSTLFYCIPVGLYIFWAERMNRWKPLETAPTQVQV